MRKRQIRANRFLPIFVTRFTDRHGKDRLRFRRKGFPSHYFTAALGTEDFRTEYAACTAPERKTEAARAAIGARIISGSVDDLMRRYLSTAQRLGPTLPTQKKVRAVLDHFAEARGERLVADIRFDHIDAILARRRVKTIVRGRASGGFEAARKLRKELIRLFDFAVKIGMITANPAALSDKVKQAPGQSSLGFYTWTEDDIAQYRAVHPIGGKARLAMELMLWTDQRRSDAIHLGRQHIRDGCFHIRQSKTGKTLIIPVAPQIAAVIIAMPRHDGLCFLTNERGLPFTNGVFGNWFRDQCNAAGLPKCTAHGLRKATMRRMAELGITNQVMKSISGHSKDEEVATYTASANQKQMATAAIQRLSAWETSNLPPRLDTKRKIKE